MTTSLLITALFCVSHQLLFGNRHETRLALCVSISELKTDVKSKVGYMRASFSSHQHCKTKEDRQRNIILTRQTEAVEQQTSKKQKN